VKSVQEIEGQRDQYCDDQQNQMGLRQVSCLVGLLSFTYSLAAKVSGLFDD